MHEFKNQDLVTAAEAYNNTFAWEFEGMVYVDTLRNPKDMANYLQNLNVPATVEILHETKDPDILFGEKSTGLVFGGQPTIANILRVRLN